VFIIGSNLNGATAVDFGSHAATFETLGNSVIVALAPPGHGHVSVTVTTAGGTSATSPFTAFAYTRRFRGIWGF